MVEIYVDGVRCDLREGYTLPKQIFKIDMAATADVERQRSGHEVVLQLPSSSLNDKLMCYAADPCCGERFNASVHEAVVKVDGVELMRGVATLVAIECSGEEVNYLVRLRSGGSDWVEGASLTSLRDALPDYQSTLDGETILESWGEDAVI